MRQDPGFRHLGLPRGACVDAASRAVDTRDAVRRIFAAYASALDKPRAGDKTPYYVLWLPALARAFPEMRFVHIIRDGRDVAASLIEADFGPAGIGEAAFYWRKRVVAGRRAGAALGCRRYLEVRYEDLVGDPERVLREVCSFVDLPFDGTMLGYFEHPERAIGSTTVPGQHANLRLPPTAGLRSWRESLTPTQLALADAVAGDALVDLGYPRTPATGRTGSARDVALAWVSWKSWARRRELSRRRGQRSRAAA